eukprot:scaffold23116_cov103-Isochrysis_galbana.AAC.2
MPVLCPCVAPVPCAPLPVTPPCSPPHSEKEYAPRSIERSGVARSQSASTKLIVDASMSKIASRCRRMEAPSTVPPLPLLKIAAQKWRGRGQGVGEGQAKVAEAAGGVGGGSEMEEEEAAARGPCSGSSVSGVSGLAWNTSWSFGSAKDSCASDSKYEHSLAPGSILGMCGRSAATRDRWTGVEA